MWLERRDCDRHDLVLKPTLAISWERHFTVHLILFDLSDRIVPYSAGSGVKSLDTDL